MKGALSRVLIRDTLAPNEAWGLRRQGFPKELSLCWKGQLSSGSGPQKELALRCRQLGA